MPKMGIQQEGAVWTGAVVNVPNSLTVLRILLVPVFVGFLFREHYDYALAALLVAALTDGLDGTIARASNQQTKVGKYLDPLADKLLLTSGFITLAWLHLVPAWIAVLVVGRDLVLMTATLVARVTAARIDITPTLLGKGTTLLQLIYMFLALLLIAREMDPGLIQPLLYLTAGVTLLSGLHYLYRGATRNRARTA
jgi:cardiolipin synthase